MSEDFVAAFRTGAMNTEVPEIQNLFRIDSQLENFTYDIKRRYYIFQTYLQKIETDGGGFDNFTRGYKYYGMHLQPDTQAIICREWAPKAKALFLMGEFNRWNPTSHPYSKREFGKWELILPPTLLGNQAIKHLQEVKIVIITERDERVFRLSPYANYVVQPAQYDEQNYKQLFYDLPEGAGYQFKFKNIHKGEFKRDRLKIYEAHIGIATEEYAIGTYDNFTEKIIPRIVKQGYNAIQLMGIMEHAYYASFGYQVTSFYAASSRFGIPDDLKRLVDVAHRNNLMVLLDLVHSHASKNVLDGLNMFDGSDSCFFHSGSRGTHPVWDSRCFNYGDFEVTRFLLSNIRWWMEEYHFDGFRFDGCTSMMYHCRGVNGGFTGNYAEYFGLNVDNSALVYLMLANYLIHKIDPDAISIAEEVSGMPAICRPIAEGGFGFNYRLAMAIPDKWISLLRNFKDEDWSMGDIVYTLQNRRWLEPTIAYSECHDQALVGDKTIAFWLMDDKMYSNMGLPPYCSPCVIIDRGIALHKMIRLITCALGGEGWLNFMGNEFGHPEWLDFPREENLFSFHYARRQWSLIDNTMLRYHHMNDWDIAMMKAEDTYQWLASDQTYVSLKHEEDKVIVFERGQCVFVFNFNPNKSFPDYKIGVGESGQYKIVLCSDDEIFGGFIRVDTKMDYFTSNESFFYRKFSLKLYLPCRTCLCLVRICG